MFAWYERSSVCYAYLSDVPTGLIYGDLVKEGSAVRRSLWFTRGWTLQELLAPHEVEFIDREWNDLAHKSDNLWMNLVSEITGITNSFSFKDACVAQKMSWLSRRETTRIEDMAYCMLGIFGVFMPPLYGEEEHAFQRLQMEILKVSDDRSIFAWKSQQNEYKVSPDRGLLAQHPIEFKDSGGIEAYDHSSYILQSYTMTNRGIAIRFRLELIGHAPLGRVGNRDWPLLYKASLDCHDYNQGDTPIDFGIYLIQYAHRGPMFRLFANHFAFMPDDKSFTNSLIFKDAPPLSVLPETEHSELIHVPKPIGELVYGPFYMEIEVLGKYLQKRLFNISMDDPGRSRQNCWVEPKPFQFKVRMIAKDAITFHFKPTPISSSYSLYRKDITVVIKLLNDRMEDIKSTFVEEGDLRPKRQPPTSETGTVIRVDELAYISDQITGIKVSQPEQRVFRYKIWSLDDKESTDLWRGCIHQNVWDIYDSD